jgi:hypothetical protein
MTYHILFLSPRRLPSIGGAGNLQTKSARVGALYAGVDWRAMRTISRLRANLQ